MNLRSLSVAWISHFDDLLFPVSLHLNRSLLASTLLRTRTTTRTSLFPRRCRSYQVLRILRNTSPPPLACSPMSVWDSTNEIFSATPLTGEARLRVALAQRLDGVPRCTEGRPVSRLHTYEERAKLRKAIETEASALYACFHQPTS